MADEGVAPVSQAPASAADHGFTSHEHAPVFMNANSRKSTWSKSMPNVHVNGTSTPMSNLRHSRFEPAALDSYFVRLSPSPSIQQKKQILICVFSGRTPQSRSPFQTPLFHAYPRLRNTTHDPPFNHDRPLEHTHNLHF